MTYMQDQIERVRRIADEIKRLEDQLTGNAVIPMSEWPKIHAEIRRLKRERDLLEQRTRNRSEF